MLVAGSASAEPVAVEARELAPNDDAVAGGVVVLEEVLPGQSTRRLVVIPRPTEPAIGRHSVHLVLHVHSLHALVEGSEGLGSNQ